jgi:multicomponent Na+:H+ antiporter subunit E
MTFASLFLLAALWWLLTGPDPQSWVVGGPAIAAALAVRRRLKPFAASYVSPTGAARFLAFFFRASIAGGVDVVRRAFDPRMPLDPGLTETALRLEEPAGRILAAGAVSLLPGTLTADMDEHRLTVHALDLRLPVRRQLEELEARVAGLNLGSEGSHGRGP